MAESVKISALSRTGKGSSEGRRLRRQGFFPGIVYGLGKDAELVKVNERDFRRGLLGHASEHVLLDLDIEGKNSVKVLLQEVQHDSLTGQILHADFHEISMTEKIRVEVQVELIGVPVGVSLGGGVLEQMTREVEVECLPGDLMEHIDVDVSKLAVGDHITVADIKLDGSKYEILTDPEVAIAAVAEPTEEIVAEVPEAVEGEAGAEGGEGAEAAEGDAKEANSEKKTEKASDKGGD